MVAAVACETGIPINDLLDAPPGMLEAVVKYLENRAKARG